MGRNAAEQVRQWEQFKDYIRTMAGTKKRSKHHSVGYNCRGCVAEVPVEFNPAIDSEHIVVTVYGPAKPQLGCIARVTRRTEPLKRLLWDAHIPYVSLGEVYSWGDEKRVSETLVIVAARRFGGTSARRKPRRRGTRSKSETHG